MLFLSFLFVYRHILKDLSYSSPSLQWVVFCFADAKVKLFLFILQNF